jgi:polar amino acid transport system substrate-binding protein
VLLPELRKQPDLRFTGVATATGLSGTHTAEKFGFGFATTDAGAVLRDADTDVVFVVTRHDTHAPLAIAALEAGKHVFVEKPLAINREQLDAVIAAAEASDKVLMVGFNRRFAPLIVKARETLQDRSAPLVMLYRVNAGPLPAGSWQHGAEGAGRIIGEACHFVDTLSFVAGSLPVKSSIVYARNLDDAATLQLTFADGSIGTIVYTSLGDRSFPKEYIEIFGAGRVITIDDFRRAVFVTDGRTRRARLGRQDKGFAEELRQFLAAVRGQQPPPIGLEALQATTEGTFASLRSGHGAH